MGLSNLDRNTLQAETRRRYDELRDLWSEHLKPRAPNQFYVIDGIVAEALGFADNGQRDRVEHGLSGASTERIEAALARLDCLLGLTRAYVAYTRHRNFTRRPSWFVRLLRRT